MGIFDKIKNIFSTNTESKKKQSNLKLEESHKIKRAKQSSSEDPVDEVSTSEELVEEIQTSDDPADEVSISAVSYTHLTLPTKRIV